MGKENKEALQVTKEIIVKFIETQRISPSNFAEHFPAIYKIVLDTLEDNATLSYAEEEQLRSVQEKIEVLLPEQEQEQRPTMEQTM